LDGERFARKLTKDSRPRLLDQTPGEKPQVQNQKLRFESWALLLGGATWGADFQPNSQVSRQQGSRPGGMRWVFSPRRRDGCTMTMLLARGVKVETIDELLAAGLATKNSELVGRGRPIEITRIAITDAGRLALERGTALWSLCQIVPDPAGLDPLMGRAAIA
jgi:hypothetical protein